MEFQLCNMYEGILGFLSELSFLKLPSSTIIVLKELQIPANTLSAIVLSYKGRYIYIVTNEIRN